MSARKKAAPKKASVKKKATSRVVGHSARTGRFVARLKVSATVPAPKPPKKK